MGDSEEPHAALCDECLGDGECYCIANTRHQFCALCGKEFGRNVGAWGQWTGSFQGNVVPRSKVERVLRASK